MHETREAWLQAAVAELRPLLKQAGAKVPDVAVSVGFPSTGKRGKRIGECWSSTAGNGTNQMFIHPKLTDPIDVLGTLAHELIHAADNCTGAHGAAFKRIAETLGLEGKMTATVVGPALREALDEIAADLGPFPHGGLQTGTTPDKKQSTRLRAMKCKACGCTIRVTRKWIDEYAEWRCPCGDEFTEES